MSVRWAATHLFGESTSLIVPSRQIHDQSNTGVISLQQENVLLNSRIVIKIVKGCVMRVFTPVLPYNNLQSSCPTTLHTYLRLGVLKAHLLVTQHPRIPIYASAT